MSEKTEKMPSGFMLQDEVIESITIMTAEELQSVLLAAVAYFRGEEVEEPGGSGIVLLTFRMLRKDIDNGLLKYQETCERNGKIARQRYAENTESTARDEPSPTRPDTDTNTNTDSDSYSDTKAGSARRTPAAREKRLAAQKKKQEELDSLSWITRYLDTHRIRTDDEPVSGRGGNQISPAS